MSDVIPDAIQLSQVDVKTPSIDDVYTELVALRRDFAKVVDLVVEVGPTLEMLMAEAKEKGLMGIIPILMQMRKG